MKRYMVLVLAGSILAAVGGYLLLNRQSQDSGIEISQAPTGKQFVLNQQPAAGLCPWRDPKGDLKRFFPGALAYRDETLILSRYLKQIEVRLGRSPTGDDSVLVVHRVMGRSASPGVIVTRRLRGESGVIEMALAVDNGGTVVGARLQRLREPDIAAHALQSEFLEAFRGKNCRSAWQPGNDLPLMPTSRESARAIATEAHTVLILMDVGAREHAIIAPHVSAIVKKASQGA